MASENIFALDLGTTKFCIAALYARGSKELTECDAVSVPARGMKRGMLADLKLAQQTVCQLIDLAEKEFGTEIKRVAVGVAGSHLGHFREKYSIELAGEEISTATLERLLTLTRKAVRRPHREILHVLPVHYTIDDREPVINPAGFSGRKICGEYFVVDADEAYLRDIVQLCNQAGLEVTRLCAESVASASVTVTEQQKKLGVIVADIGGGTTDGLVFQNGHPIASFSVNIGGTLMTHDLAIGLNLEEAEAERVKTFFGLRRKHPETLVVTDISGKERTITGSEVFDILGPRVLELAKLMAEKVRKYKGHLGAGLLLTGGGSEVHEISLLLEKIFDIPVTKSAPLIAVETPKNAATEALKRSFATKLATAFGMINLELLDRSFKSGSRKTIWSNQYIHQFVNWIKELS